MTPRKLRPRPPVVATPLYVSQHTAPTLFGFKTGDSFLELVNRQKVEHVRYGKTVLVDVNDLNAALRAMTPAGDEAANSTDAADDDEHVTADAILASMGRRRVR